MNEKKALSISVAAILIMGPLFVVFPASEGLEPGKTNMMRYDTPVYFHGESSDDYAGFGISGAGDVNGDGYDDILIGAYGDDDGGTDAGQTYLVFGNASGWAVNTDFSGASASLWGENAGDNSGYCVAGAGDVNGDGYDDVIIGAPLNDEGGTDAGQIYLIFGKASGWAMDIDLSYASASFWGEAAGDEAGFSIAGVGDLNWDGYDDILIGAPANDNGGTDAGQIYVVFGKASGWTMDTNLSTVPSFWGEDAADYAGYSVAGAGDVNGDGFGDILAGAYGDDDGGLAAGQTYLILSKRGGWAMDNDLANASASFWGENAGDYSGYSVAGAGDVNGDGYHDILIGAHRNDENGVDAGQTYLIFGKTSGWAMDVDLSAVSASYWGESGNALTGISVASAGDVNSDGYDDILIGSRLDIAGPTAGTSYIVMGKASGWAMDMPIRTSSEVYWGKGGDESGRTVAGAGDVNGDGHDDFLIGAWKGFTGGKTYVIFANAAPPAPGNLTAALA